MKYDILWAKKAADILKDNADFNDDRVLIPNEVIKMTSQREYSLIKAWRVYLKLSQKHVAQELGITPGAYCQIEQSANPQKETIRKISQVFKLSPSQLCWD